MILPTVPSWANTISVIPPIYSLSNGPKDLRARSFSTSEVKLVTSVKIAPRPWRRCTSMPSLSPLEASRLARSAARNSATARHARGSASACRERRASATAFLHGPMVSVDGDFEVAEIDRLWGEEVERPAVHAAVRMLGSCRHRRTPITVDFLSSALLQPREQRQPVHPGHVDVAHDHVDHAGFALSVCQRLEAVLGEHHLDGQPSRICPAGTSAGPSASRSGSSSTRQNQVAVMRPVRGGCRSPAARRQKSIGLGQQSLLRRARSPCAASRRHHRR